nr:reverse transcriptase domain-containing protein [Tanacetum cinerariifolium]
YGEGKIQTVLPLLEDKRTTFRGPPASQEVRIEHLTFVSDGRGFPTDLTLLNTENSSIRAKRRGKPNFTILSLSELRDQAYENSFIYKERTKKLHDKKIKNRIFNVGDQVLLFNSRLKIFSGKLKSRWSGPFTICEIYPYGTVKLVHPDGCNFKVNCHRLKHYHGGDPPPLEIPDV